jgi:hypothetical protein
MKMLCIKISSLILLIHILNHHLIYFVTENAQPQKVIKIKSHDMPSG